MGNSSLQPEKRRRNISCFRERCASSKANVESVSENNSHGFIRYKTNIDASKTNGKVQAMESLRQIYA